MVRTTGEWFYNALHFQLEKEGIEFSYGDVGVNGQHVLLLVATIGECIDHALFVGVQVGEDGALDALFPDLLLLCSGLPRWS